MIKVIIENALIVPFLNTHKFPEYINSLEELEVDAKFVFKNLEAALNYNDIFLSKLTARYKYCLCCQNKCGVFLYMKYSNINDGLTFCKLTYFGENLDYQTCGELVINKVLL